MVLRKILRNCCPYGRYVCKLMIYSSSLDYRHKLVDKALIQYLFDGPEHAVLVKPHGNSKTMLELYLGVSQNLTPKFAICEVSKSLGDVITLPSAGLLPRSSLILDVQK